MSWIGVIFVSAFSANAFLTWGLGAREVLHWRRRFGAADFSAALAVNIAASSLFWAIDRLVLAPLDARLLEVPVFLLAIVPALRALLRLLAARGGSLVAARVTRIDESILGCLVFGIALLSSKGGYSLAEAVLASASSVIGWSLSLGLLGAIGRRMELSPMPRALREGPAMLVSAGLMAMAFAAFDVRFVSGLVR